MLNRIVVPHLIIPDTVAYDSKYYPFDILKTSFEEYEEKVPVLERFGCFISKVNVSSSTLDVNDAAFITIHTIPDIVNHRFVSEIQILDTPKGSMLKHRIDPLKIRMYFTGFTKYSPTNILISLDVFFFNVVDYTNNY